MIPVGIVSSHRSFASVSGGILYTGANHYYRRFNSSSQIVISEIPLETEVLMVAGGGGGGYADYDAWNQILKRGGGGGAGRFAIETIKINPGTVGVTVGAGGTGYPNITNGEPTKLSGSNIYIYLDGGGKGGDGGQSFPQPGSSGGSGGGGGAGPGTTTYGLAIDSPSASNDLGYRGGTGGSSSFGGGGGGAAGVGEPATYSGTGGAGINMVNISEEWSSVVGLGVLARGGSSPGTANAANNTGNGGSSSNSGGSFAGGSGIVVFKYLKSAVE